MMISSFNLRTFISFYALCLLPATMGFVEATEDSVDEAGACVMAHDKSDRAREVFGMATFASPGKKINGKAQGKWKDDSKNNHNGHRDADGKHGEGGKHGGGGKHDDDGPPHPRGRDRDDGEGSSDGRDGFGDDGTDNRGPGGKGARHGPDGKDGPGGKDGRHGKDGRDGDGPKHGKHGGWKDGQGEEREEDTWKRKGKPNGNWSAGSRRRSAERNVTRGGGWQEKKDGREGPGESGDRSGSGDFSGKHFQFTSDSCRKAKDEESCGSERMAKFACHWLAPVDGSVPCQGRNVRCEQGNDCSRGQSIGKCANGGMCCMASPGDKRSDSAAEGFTGACVSKLSWCFQAGTDEELCEPLVKTGQCAFVQIGDYVGCIANKDKFDDRCYQKAEDSPEKCREMPENMCAFVKTQDSMSLQPDGLTASGSAPLQTCIYLLAISSRMIW
eukprot:gnl/MRDRNA2_/MRDRNA2_98327_c0_seq1.p1 gnl/MRDRNA2_/MRDRNA2_98327_c0~~gnl/MRDRNA2_/MRDRNA2_98327_c0_seq1.p1  ORF type:complete len:443 (-),score=95.05 gnl/MRDRNA2_/MRDRNA2_98327_c0_seq1:151-1479(-)